MTSPAPQPAATTREYVRLVSADKFEFVIPREVAEQSRTINELLRGCEEIASGLAGGTMSDDASGQSRVKTVETMHTLPLEDISTPVLQLVCQYLMEKRCSRSSMSEFRELKSLDPTKEADKQLVLELLLAADYLDC